jgi:hypothetical protein
MKVLTRFTFLLLASFAIHYSQAQTIDSTLKGMNWRNIGKIEENLYQVRNQSSQDPLNFPIKLNTIK